MNFKQAGAFRMRPSRRVLVMILFSASLFGLGTARGNPLRGTSALIVGTGAAHNQFLHDLLREHGCTRITTVRTPEDALQRAAQQTFDFGFFDYVLRSGQPEFPLTIRNGSELALKLRESGAQFPVFLWSADPNSIPPAELNYISGVFRKAKGRKERLASALKRRLAHVAIPTNQCANELQGDGPTAK